MTSRKSAVRPLTLLREKDFAHLLTGQFLSALGDKIHYVALGVLIFRLICVCSRYVEDINRWTGNPRGERGAGHYVRLYSD